MKKDKKKDKPVNKTPELSKAKKALDAYLKENNLDPQKDWSKDKKHGKKVTELLNKLNKEPSAEMTVCCTFLRVVSIPIYNKLLI